jgi:rSAM/selenodomain-associated transferase 2
VARPEFSVIIPTLEEEELVEGAIDSALAAYGDACQIVVVDGGSSDRTARVAARRVEVLVTSGGRGPQLNRGAERARGAILVFLHADTRVDASSGQEIIRRLSRPEIVGGCHRFQLDPPPPSVSRWRLLEAAVNLRTRILGTATGDQAIFVRRDRFHEVGGFPDYPLFEDVALVRRLRRVGTFTTLVAGARTSRRRWEEGGFLRTVALHCWLRTAFALGVEPVRLADWYGSPPGRFASGTLTDERVDP